MFKDKIEVHRASLDFFKYEDNGLTCYEFDARECSPPEPMVNAITGLSLLKEADDRLIGIFFHEPTPLYERMGDTYTHEAIELSDGDFKVIFKLA